MTKPETAARLLLDIIEASVKDGDDAPLEGFFAAIAADPRVINPEEAGPALADLAAAVAPALTHLWQRETS